MEYILEPVTKRFAISTSTKVACATIRYWLWEISGLPRTTPNIFDDFQPYMIYAGKPLPASVETMIAIHRDPVSRMRAVYDHRIVKEREAPDNGLDHFARHLPEYCAIYKDVGHHCRAQSSWLGSEQRLFTDILPFDQLNLLPDLVGQRIGKTLPPLPRYHETKQKSAVSEESAYWFQMWSAHDTGLGWDGKTMRLLTP